MHRREGIALLTRLLTAGLCVFGSPALAETQVGKSLPRVVQPPPPAAATQTPPPPPTVKAQSDLTLLNGFPPLNVRGAAADLLIQGRNINLTGGLELIAGGVVVVSVMPTNPQAYPAGTYTLTVVAVQTGGSGVMNIQQRYVPLVKTSCPVSGQIPQPGQPLPKVVCSLVVPIPAGGGQQVFEVTTNMAGILIAAVVIN